MPISALYESIEWEGEDAQSGAKSSGDPGCGRGTAKPRQSVRGSNPFPWEPRVSGNTEMPLRLWMGHRPEHSGLPPETLRLSGESGFSVGVRRKRGRKLTGLPGWWLGLWLLMEAWRSVQATSAFLSADRMSVLGQALSLTSQPRCVSGTFPPEGKGAIRR